MMLNFKKFIGFLHLWLGLASGLVVFILGLTGCIYTFEDEIRNVVYHDRLYVTPQNGPKLPVSQMWNKAQVALGKEFPISNFEISNEADRSYRFMAYKINEKGLTYFSSREFSYNVYLNPYTGKVLDIENNKYEFFTLVLYLHYDLFLLKTGKQIVGWSTVIFIVLLISGLVLWWPKNKAAAKQRYWFQWKSSTKWKRKNYDLHNIIGFYFLGVCLIIGLTGLVWAFTWFSESVQYLVNGGVSMKKPEIVLSDTTAAHRVLPIDRIHQDVSLRVPDAASYSFFIPPKKDAAFNATALFKGTKRFKFVTNQYDRYSGQFLKTRRYEEKPRGEKLRNMNYDIHVGSILGFPGKILAFLASFTATGLPITGVAIWWGRRKKGKEKLSLKPKGHVQSPPIRKTRAFNKSRTTVS